MHAVSPVALPWYNPQAMAKVATVLASVLITLGVVAGGLALDRTVLHWYSETASGPAASDVLGEATQPTPSSPAHTAPEILQAAKVQRPRWCNNDPVENIFQIAGSPKWDKVRRIWTLSCSLLQIESDPPGSEPFQYTFCLHVDDLTLEVSSGPNSEQENFRGC